MIPTSPSPTAPRRPLDRRARHPGTRVRDALALLGALAIAGCGGGGAGDGGSGGEDEGDGGSPGGRPVAGAGTERPDGECGVEAMNATVEGHMRDYYLFADRVPRVRASDHDSPEALLEALRVDPPDAFSYIGDAGLTNAFFEEGVRFGYGWIIRTDARGRRTLALVEPGSPLELAGVVRGEALMSVNGETIDELVAGDRVATVLGAPGEARTVELGIEGVDGAVRTVTVTSGEYDVTAVADVRTLEPAGPGGPKVGYLLFQDFVATAGAELDAAFAYLAGEGVGELVLDLRYNGGGRIDVARDLASRIVGDSVAGRDFARFRLNERYQGAYEAAGRADDLAVPFADLPDSLDLARVHVLATERTCSASEMVVNGLAPFVDVVTVGAHTCGKPYGFSGREFCGKVLNAVEFEFVNDAGVGGYVDGLSPDCPVADDLARPFGDPAEGMLAAALASATGDGCPALLADAPDGALAARERSGPVVEPANPYRDEFRTR